MVLVSVSIHEARVSSTFFGGLKASRRWKLKKIIILENIKSNELSRVFSKIVCKGLCCDKVWGISIFPSCTPIRGIYRKSLLRTVIFPIRLSLRTDQQPKQFRIFSIFSAKLSLIVVSGSVDSQTPSTLTFLFCQLKSFSGCSFSLLPAPEPIQRASVFLLFSLRPEANQNLYPQNTGTWIARRTTHWPYLNHLNKNLKLCF